MENYIEQFGRAWVWTVGIEVALLFIATRFLFFKISDASILKVSSAGLFASSLTLPYLWFVASVYLGHSSELKWIAEPIIYGVEALFYAGYLRIHPMKGFALSAICNTGSLLFGILFFQRFIAD
ncbi:MAG: hypothetical protein EOP10_21265 [Proteobacteria bacterium]|nr:MAG: hypothetical protein EOP10_21265 [Pseudomonadota bacterium]